LASRTFLFLCDVNRSNRAFEFSQAIHRPMATFIFDRSPEIRNFTSGLSFVSISVELGNTFGFSGEITTEFSRILSMSRSSASFFDRLQISRLELNTAYLVGAIDLESFVERLRELDENHTSYAASHGLLINLGSPIDVNVSTVLFGNYCSSNEVRKLFAAQLINQVMVNSSNYDAKDGTLFKHYTSRQIKRFLKKKVRVEPTAVMLQSIMSNIGLCDIHEPVFPHYAEKDDFVERDSAQEDKLAHYNAMGVDRTASRYLTFCNKVEAQALVRKIETGKTLSCVGGTRFFPAVFPGVLNCNNKYETTVPDSLFLKHSGNTVHVENYEQKHEWQNTSLKH
jgi:hypothetical protein